MIMRKVRMIANRSGYIIDLVNLYETPRNEQLQQHNGNYQVNNQQHEHNIHTTTSEDGQYTFAQNAANKLPVSGTDGHLYERTLCYNCQTYGHYAGNCNEPNIRGTTLVYDGFVMNQTVCKKYNPISKEWIILDTQSTMSVFNHKQFLTNIQESKETLHAITNGGIKIHTRLENSQIWGLCGTTITQSQISCQ